MAAVAHHIVVGLHGNGLQELVVWYDVVKLEHLVAPQRRKLAHWDVDGQRGVGGVAGVEEPVQRDVLGRVIGTAAWECFVPSALIYPPGADDHQKIGLLGLSSVAKVLHALIPCVLYTV
eukprot:CAMPEP_0117654778 /NCGR_PEP_ID=MMETSP0804-20121206/3928_1 /TAXON_ID=1074897 /ORGANISM="Tetraselmis astigmatica, Strain CCMP880" /LENGTH=118 /DNA_ID=CAMNT_0005461087 /DNA_START=710 /DNA_END=1066 /DNA_ORIENTATION=-